MAAKYHINPNTGVPNICQATEGNCPYGKHYITFSEAQAASEKFLKEKYGLLPNQPSALDDVEALKSRIEEFRKISPIKRMPGLTPGGFEGEAMARLLGDEEFLMGIINGDIYVDRKGWKHVSLVLQNPCIPRYFIDDVIYNDPVSYHIEVKRWLMLNEALTPEDLLHVINNSKDDVTKAIALYNPSLGKDNVVELISQKSKGELARFPWCALKYNKAATKDKLETSYESLSGKKWENMTETEKLRKTLDKYKDFFQMYGMEK